MKGSDEKCDKEFMAVNGKSRPRRRTSLVLVFILLSMRGMRWEVQRKERCRSLFSDISLCGTCDCRISIYSELTDTKRERKPWPSITNLSAYSVGRSSLINPAHFIVTITGFPVCGI